MKRFNTLSQNSRPSRLAAALSLAAMVSAGCSGEPESTIPNVEAVVVLQDVEGQSDRYALAYGFGLRLGCNPELLLDDNGQFKFTADAQTAYERIFEQDSQTAEAGFMAGAGRGLLENQNPDSEVCQ